MTTTHLCEAVTSLPRSVGNGKYKVRIIATDVQGSSGYYPRDTIERDIALAFPKGTKIYADHPTEDEDRLRPERSIEKIAGKFVTDPWMESDGAYAEVQFGGKYKEIVEDFHDIIGMSIRASGDLEEKDILGESKNVVTRIAASPLNSVDLVTVPGAKGAVVEALTESLKEASALSGNQPDANGAQENGNNKMEKEILEAIKGLSDSFTAFVTEQKALAEKAVQSDAEAKTIEEKVSEAVKVRTAALAEIDAAAEELLPSQVESLRAKVAEGADIAAPLAEAKSVRAEALKVLTESVSDTAGRVLGSTKVSDARELGKVF